MRPRQEVTRLDRGSVYASSPAQERAALGKLIALPHSGVKFALN